MPLVYFLRKKSLWVFILLVGLIIRLSFGYFSESIKLYTYQIAREYSGEIIEKIVKGDILEVMQEGSMMTSILNNDGDVIYSYIDSYKVNKIRSIASTKMVEAIELIELHEDMQMVSLPLGYFFSRNIFLSNGIKVPINLEVVGSHQTDILVSATSYGINSSIVEIYLEISIEVQVTIPFQASAIDTTSRIPLSIEIINGDVPQYYYNGITPIPTVN